MKWLRKLAALLCLASPALAANSTTVDSIAYRPTYHSIGIRVYYSGADDDTNATVTGTIKRTGASSVDTLPPFVRTHWNAATGATRKYWATSALYCGSDTTYTINITVTDAGGCTGCTPGDQSVTTWAPPIDNVPTSTVWMGPFGSDANSGLTSSAPKVSFAGAMAILSATPGAQIRMLPGTYYTQRTDSLFVGQDTRNGTISERNSIVADQGLGSVIISGADTLSLAGEVWNTETIFSGITGYTRVITGQVWPRSVGIDDTLKLYPYPTLYQLKTDPHGVVSNWGAFCVDSVGRKVLIRLPSSISDIDGHTVHVSRKAQAVRIESAFWRVNGLTFKDFGVGYNSSGISSSVVNLANQGGIIENCKFMRLSRAAIGFRNYSGTTQFRTHRNLSQRNIFEDALLSQPWTGAISAATGAGTFKTINAYMTCPGALDSCAFVNTVFPTHIIENGTGNVIRYNFVRGWTDGFIRLSGQGVDTTQLANHTDADIYQNLLMNYCSDVFEPEDVSGLNVRIFKNVVMGGASMINQAIRRGPMYFVHNLGVNNLRLTLPIGTGGLLDNMRGHLFWVNNTFITSCAENLGSALWSQPQTGTSNVYVNNVVVNNAFYSTLKPMWYESGCLLKNHFNYNKWGSGHATDFYVNYSAFRNNLSGLQTWRDSTYGYGANDTFLGANDFLVSDSTGWDWSAAPGSQLASGARSMPGINTNHANHGSPWAPDGELHVGAYGYGGMAKDGWRPKKRGWLRRLLGP